MNTNSIPYLERALQINDALLGLPALPLVFMACLVWGYFLKTMPIYPNRWIPFGNFVFGIAANLSLSGANVRSALLGLIAAATAWYVHRKYLSEWIDEKWFTPEDTEHINKEDKE